MNPKEKQMIKEWLKKNKIKKIKPKDEIDKSQSGLKIQCKGY